MINSFPVHLIDKKEKRMWKAREWIMKCSGRVWNSQILRKCWNGYIIPAKKRIDLKNENVYPQDLVFHGLHWIKVVIVRDENLHTKSLPEKRTNQISPSLIYY